MDIGAGESNDMIVCGSSPWTPMILIPMVQVSGGAVGPGAPEQCTMKPRNVLVRAAGMARIIVIQTELPVSNSKGAVSYEITDIISACNIRFDPKPSC